MASSIGLIKFLSRMLYHIARKCGPSSHWRTL